MRTLAIGDIHGGLKGLKQLLQRVNLETEDQIIFMGDYVDGWSESAGVISYLIEMSENYNCVFIKGNHDVWCENWLLTGRPENIWLQHGGNGTIESYKQLSAQEKLSHLKFFKNTKLFHLDAKNRLFIHAGFTSMHGVEQEKHESSFYFDRTLWEMALTLDKRIDRDSDLYPKRLNLYDEIFIGHTPTLNFNSDDPMKAGNVWNVDTGAAFYGKLSAVDINSKEIFQSDVLMELYPEEKGRNERSLNQILGR